MNKYKEEQIGQSRFSISQYIQLVIVILYTKYELSILYSYGGTFDEKCREKKRINIGMNKQEKAGSQSHYATSHCQFSYKTLTFYLK